MVHNPLSAVCSTPLESYLVELYHAGYLDSYKSRDEAEAAVNAWVLRHPDSRRPTIVSVGCSCSK